MSTGNGNQNPAITPTDSGDEPFSFRLAPKVRPRFYESRQGFFGLGRSYVATAGIDLVSQPSMSEDWTEALRTIVQWRHKRGRLARTVYFQFLIPSRALQLIQEVKEHVRSEVLAGRIPAPLQGLQIELYLFDGDGELYFDVILDHDGKVERLAERKIEESKAAHNVHGPAYPWIVTMAGVIWISFGGLVLLSTPVFLAAMGKPAGLRAYGSGAFVVCVFAALSIGAGFIYIGVEAIRGNASDMLADGIGSLILGVLSVGSALLELQISTSARDFKLAIMLPCLVMAGGFMAAGILALGGRKDYKAWRKAQQADRPTKMP